MPYKNVGRLDISTLQLGSQLSDNRLRVTRADCRVAAGVASTIVSESTSAACGYTWLDVFPDIHRIAKAGFENDGARTMSLEAHDVVQIYIRNRHGFHARQTKEERG